MKSGHPGRIEVVAAVGTEEVGDAMVAAGAVAETGAVGADSWFGFQGAPADPDILRIAEACAGPRYSCIYDNSPDDV